MVDNRLIARIARQHGSRLMNGALDKAIDRVMPAVVEAPRKTPGLLSRMATAALMRVALRSVPGAIVVGGGLIAKRLHDRHKANQRANVRAKSGK